MKNFGGRGAALLLIKNCTKTIKYRNTFDFDYYKWFMWLDFGDPPLKIFLNKIANWFFEDWRRAVIHSRKEMGAC